MFELLQETVWEHCQAGLKSMGWKRHGGVGGRMETCLTVMHIRRTLWRWSVALLVHDIDSVQMVRGDLAWSTLLLVSCRRIHPYRALVLGDCSSLFRVIENCKTYPRWLNWTTFKQSWALNSVALVAGSSHYTTTALPPPVIHLSLSG